MRILVNDKEIIFPSSLSEITLGQRITFYNQYGRQLDEMLKSITDMEEGPLKVLETDQFRFEKMFRTFAFFANTTPEVVKENKFIDDVADVYYSCLSVLFDDEQDLEPKPEYFFKKALWVIAAPELNQGSKMTFGEFIDAKQMTKDMNDLGAGKWEIMLKLCAIYLRKVGEEYKEEFSYEGSDRQELMKDLPMDIAMQVGFFLSGTMNFLINTLKSSESLELKEEASI